ncbi:hypothetical protein GCK72_022170 [Caenorhabditis remanei]|uniref:RING-type domain-containing protein n=1 Tax=Caenorhabditis remanei TaxID=31234 RepID=A0A6A5FT43_CAERE|nr:hypothetical protein GCK72_022170 [Caenorhabditis remanei]KAF1745723.1 hypothetical protein GCK72_022170 [Caenorhabditis remanei]
MSNLDIEAPPTVFTRAHFPSPARRGMGPMKFPLPLSPYVPEDVIKTNTVNSDILSTSNVPVFPLPVTTSQGDEFEKMKKQLVEALQKIDDYNKKENELMSKIEELDAENEKLKSEVQKLTDQDSENKNKQEMYEEKTRMMKLDTESKEDMLEILRVQCEELKNELDKVSQEKLKTDAENIEYVELLINENNTLQQENSTVKMVNNEMTQEMENLTVLKHELEIALKQKTAEPEVTLESELEDTTCAICMEEMRLKKCTPCRRRFHKSCLEHWLQGNNSCPTCRASMSV